MLIFAAAVLGLLALAAVLSRKLSRPADTLGLRTARAAVVADMHRRVSRDRDRDAVDQLWQDITAAYATIVDELTAVMEEPTR